MKRLSAVFALTALAAASVALAQQATPQTPAAPPASTSSQEQSPTTPPADPSAQPNSQDKQALMKDCLTQVQAANPTAPKDDVKAYCDKQVKSSTSPQD